MVTIIRRKMDFGIAGIIFSLLSMAVSARDLGTVGPVYGIAEESLLVSIEKQLKKSRQKGSWAELNQQMERTFTRTLENLPEHQAWSPATRARTRYFDPGVVLPADIRASDGQLLAAAGEKINPLNRVSWTRQLLFFDGRDPRQQAFVQRYLQTAASGRVKPVLVAGDLVALSAQWQRPLYYDQGGQLSARFQLEHVPALVFQEGERLRIDELPPD